MRMDHLKLLIDGLRPDEDDDKKDYSKTFDSNNGFRTTNTKINLSKLGSLISDGVKPKEMEIVKFDPSEELKEDSKRSQEEKIKIAKILLER
jgi:hypothetical protein